MKQFLSLLISIFIVLSLPLSLAAEGIQQGKCPQERKTKKAPRVFHQLKNPIIKTDKHLSEAKLIFEKTARPLQCVICHGKHGNGIGDPDFASTPAARNFTCKKTMEEISDGQLFWVIQNGSAGTSMPQFKDLDDKSIWKLIIYIRNFSKTFSLSDSRV